MNVSGVFFLLWRKDNVSRHPVTTGGELCCPIELLLSLATKITPDEEQ